MRRKPVTITQKPNGLVDSSGLTQINLLDTTKPYAPYIFNRMAQLYGLRATGHGILTNSTRRSPTVRGNGF